MEISVATWMSTEKRLQFYCSWRNDFLPAYTLCYSDTRMNNTYTSPMLRLQHSVSWAMIGLAHGSSPFLVQDPLENLESVRSPPIWPLNPAAHKWSDWWPTCTFRACLFWRSINPFVPGFGSVEPAEYTVLPAVIYSYENPFLQGFKEENTI